jgi:alanyl-tRNA synthetase
MKSCNDIRREFIEFFEQRQHAMVPSSPLLLPEDPTLLFANAGMNQFKPLFLGTETRDYVRAANTQKCIRAGGKHNDLEDVGRDCYHQTFFEMLGNWSFGDYFKAESIAWSWELLTKVWGLPKERLFVTVFGGDEADGLPVDDEAETLWRESTDIDPSHIFRFGKKDNFWEMGATGPCGPCSEIHIDLTEDGSGGPLVNAGDPSVIEIWNLVFIQFNRAEDGALSPLPAKHVDTGMGFERISMVLQGKRSNYATDVFVPIIEKIETLTDHRYGAASGLEDRFDVLGEEPGDMACRVLADHARALAFAIADGIMPSNDGRGYVLRRILRRAARYGRESLNIEGPFLTELVPTIIELMGESFPELRHRQQFVIQTIREEEESFARTLDRGIELFHREAAKLADGQELPGQVAFDLYATFGFPVDLTELMAEEAGVSVDMAGYEKAMSEHKELSGAGGAFKAADQLELPAIDDSAKYATDPVDGSVLGWVVDGQFVTDGNLATGMEAAVVLDRTNFYGEQGGQVGDAGEIVWEGGRFAVTDSKLVGTAVVHVGSVAEGSLAVGQAVICKPDSTLRHATMRNHAATHLLNWALREVLGEHVNQAGSVVSPDRLRFDFSHNQAVTAEQIAQTERFVNEWIMADAEVAACEMDLADAQKIEGLRAMFGEKYGQVVRVVTVGGSEGADGQSFPVELCGGTHVERTGEIGLFKIISEESVAKGTRRITALTGLGALGHVQQIEATATTAAKALRIKIEELPDRIDAMAKEIKELRKGGGKAAGGGEFEITGELDSPAGKVMIGQVSDADANALRTLCDVLRQKGAAAVFVAAAADGKVLLTAMVSDELIKAASIKAGDWIKAVAPVVGGGGGGKPTLAQAGGKDPAKLPEALAAAVEWVSEKLG